MRGSELKCAGCFGEGHHWCWANLGPCLTRGDDLLTCGMQVDWPPQMAPSHLVFAIDRFIFGRIRLKD